MLVGPAEIAPAASRAGAPLSSVRRRGGERLGRRGRSHVPTPTCRPRSGGGATRPSWAGRSSHCPWPVRPCSPRPVAGGWHWPWPSPSGPPAPCSRRTSPTWPNRRPTRSPPRSSGSRPRPPLPWSRVASTAPPSAVPGVVQLVMPSGSSKRNGTAAAVTERPARDVGPDGRRDDPGHRRHARRQRAAGHRRHGRLGVRHGRAGDRAAHADPGQRPGGHARPRRPGHRGRHEHRRPGRGRRRRGHGERRHRDAAPPEAAHGRARGRRHRPARRRRSGGRDLHRRGRRRRQGAPRRPDRAGQGRDQRPWPRRRAPPVLARPHGTHRRCRRQRRPARRPPCPRTRPRRPT